MKARELVRWFILASILVAGLAPYAHSEEPFQDFLVRLRERGYGELAIAYVQQLATRSDVPESLRQVLDLELSSSYRVWAQETQNADLTRQRMAESKRLFDKFAAAQPKHPAIADALLEWGDMAFDRGTRILARSEAIPDAAAKKKSRSDARAEFQEAKSQFEDAEKRYQQFQSALNIESALPEDVKGAVGESAITAEQAELGTVKARFKLAGTHFYIAQTYDESEAERKTSLELAETGFGRLSQQYGTAEVGLRAQLWQAKAREKLGRSSEALELYDDVVSGGPAKATGPLPEFAPLFAEAAAGQVRVVLKQTGGEAATKQGTEWLRTHRSWQSLAAYHGVALETAKAGLAQLADAPPDRRGKIRDDALALLATIAKTDSEFRQEAIQLRHEYLKTSPKAAGLSFDEILALGDAAAGSGKWSDASTAYQQALDQASKLSDANRITLAQQRLNLARYRLAVSLYSDRKMDEVISVVGQITKSDPKDPNAPLASSLAAFAALSLYESSPESGKAAALDRLQKIAEFTTKTWPGEAAADDAQIVLGQVYLGRGEAMKAVEFFERVGPTSARFPGAALASGRVYWKSYLDEKKKPDDSRDEAAAKEFRAKAEKALAAAAADKTAAQPDHPSFRQWFECNVLLAEIYLDAQQPSEATQTIARVLPLCKPNDSGQLDNLFVRALVAALRAYTASSQFAPAYDVAMTLAKSGPDMPLVNSVLVDYVRQLRTEYDRGQAAISKSRNALELAGLRDTQTRMAELDQQLKQLVVPLAARQQYTINAIAYVADLSDKLEMKEQSQALSERILARAEKDPDFRKGGEKAVTRVRYQMVDQLLKQNKFQTAAKHIDDLVAQNPRTLELLMKKGEVLQAWAKRDRKRYEEAVAHWTQVRLLLARTQPRPAEYYEVVFNTSACLLEWSTDLNDETKLLQAEQLLKSTLALNPTLNGAETVTRFNELLAKIEGTQLGKKKG